MKRFLCLALVGCGSVAPGVTVTSLYTPPIFGQQIGEVIRVDDEASGVTFFYLVESDRDLLIGTFLKKSSPLRSMSENSSASK